MRKTKKIIGLKVENGGEVGGGGVRNYE